MSGRIGVFSAATYSVSMNFSVKPQWKVGEPVSVPNARTFVLLLKSSGDHVVMLQEWSPMPSNWKHGCLDNISRQSFQWLLRCFSLVENGPAAMWLVWLKKSLNQWNTSGPKCVPQGVKNWAFSVLSLQKTSVIITFCTLSTAAAKQREPWLNCPVFMGTDAEGLL